MALPCLAFDPGRPPSSSPATPAAATAPANPAPPVPPPLRSLRQKPPHTSVNTSPYSILIGNHRSPKTTLLPKLPSTAKLTADDSFHPRLPSDHRKDRLSLVDPSRPSGTHGEPPFTGDDRRCLASVRAEEEEGGIDWSNLTSGPLGPTVSDPAPIHVG